MRRYLAAAAALVALGPLAGCGIHDLSFVSDTRLHFTAPRARALVKSPVTISWRMSDFEVVPPGTAPASSHSGYFAVFVDRSPVRPGQSLLAIADRSCRRTPGCFNATYMNARGVYTTNTDSLTLVDIANLNSYQTVQTHEATVVLLDSSGKRIGESAWYLDFRMRRGGP